MPISLKMLCTEIDPSKTSLILGAGAAVPSGAPTGAGLAKELWKGLDKSDPKSDDLIETASILERLHGRERMVRVVIDTLKHLQPTGGLASVPDFPWLAIYSTNFDKLVEIAYKRAGKSLTAIRSNFDLSNRDQYIGTILYKMHGCITQDRSLGDKPSMLLTEGDYESYGSFRQSIFAKLSDALFSGDVLIIGQSLQDRHLQDLIKKVLGAKKEGTPGRVYVLIYDKDDLRAPMLEDRGAKIAFGGIDELVHQLSATVPDSIAPETESSPEQVRLPALVASITIDVGHAKALKPNVSRMFNGGAASYADIVSGCTFERAGIDRHVQGLQATNTPILVITGAAGVGKTTLARQIAVRLHDSGVLCWEHNADFPLAHEQWIRIEADLRSAGKRGVLVLDECAHYMRAVNLLAEHVASVPDSALRIVLTAHASQWVPRVKSPVFFRYGTTVNMSVLENTEIYSLVNLVEHNSSISALVHSSFKSQSRDRQIAALQRKASADMFVCLKNIFANESLDIILLREYDQLSDNLRDYYKYVSALESVGMRVHRHLLVRMLGIDAGTIAAALGGLSGIVDEYDIDPRNGIYGWRTRHLVIARKITEYKFSGLDELVKLFDLIVDNMSPAVPVERLSISGLCDNDFGIGAIADPAERVRLYRKLIKLAPGERVPWHRLIRELLGHESTLDEAEYVIRDAREAVGGDAPIDRYSVRLLMARAQRTRGLAKEDKIALLRRAYELASKNIRFHDRDRYSYAILCDVAHALQMEDVDEYLMSEAINTMRRGLELICDPEMERDLRGYEREKFAVRQ